MERLKFQVHVVGKYDTKRLLKKKAEFQDQLDPKEEWEVLQRKVCVCVCVCVGVCMCVCVCLAMSSLM